MKAKSVKKKRRGRNGIYVFVTVLLTLIAIVVGIGMFFKVGSVDVAGGEVYTSEEIVTMSGIKTGDNILLLDEDEIAENIKSKLIYIDSVTLVRTYPDRIILEITEDAPIATTKADGATWYINTAGKLFEADDEIDEDSLVMIVGAKLQEPKAGEIAVTGGGETQLECITEFLTAVRKNSLENKISYVNVSNIGSISFDYEARFTVNLGSQGDIGDKMDMLVGAINRIEPGARGKLEFTSDIELHFVPEN